MRLDVDGWKEFKVSDIFDVKYGVNLELNACEEVGKDEPNSVNFVARTAENNGVSARVKIIEGVEPQKAGLISVAGGGSVLSTFLQYEPFYSGRDLYTLEAKTDISNEAKLFIITVIEQNKYKYSYGRQANKTLPDILLKLPVMDDGQPDYGYMESFIKSIHYKPLTTKVVKSNINLRADCWKPFKVSSILTILNGKGITTEEIEDNPGDFTVVQSGEENNGVLGKISLDYCKSVGYTYSEKECLTVARSGSAGFVSFQKFGCVVGDSAKILLLDEKVANTYVYLFVRTVLMANKYKYAYGRKVTENKYMDDYIELPAKDELGEWVPDWEYMKNYIKSLPYGDRL